jgi:N-acyltransferase N-terminal domain
VARGFRLPDRAYVPEIFDRLAIVEDDRLEILAAWPSAETDPTIRRSLERAYETLVEDLGGFGPLDLPGPTDEVTALGRYFFVYVYLAALADVRRYHARRRILDEI